MATWFVSRHAGAVEWLGRRGLRVDRLVPHLDVADIHPGDRVVGALPAHLAAEVCRRGGRYFHLVLDVPPEARGGTWTAGQMDAMGARLEEYRVERVDPGPETEPV